MFKKIIVVIFICIILFGCGKSDTGNNDVIVGESQNYRNILIADYTGSVDVTRSEGDRLAAYIGLTLFNGDDVCVYESSTLILGVDDDKYLFAEENTRFWLEAVGDDKNTKTRIHLEDGSVLCRVENKLNAEEYFEVVTSSATMSVKGTVFRISKFTASDHNCYIFVEVFDGVVYTQLNYSNDTIDVTAGHTALIKEGSKFASPKFINEDQINNESWDISSLDLLINKNSNVKSVLLSIPYLRLPKSTVDFLIDMSNDGEQLVISKEFLEAIRNEICHTFDEITFIPATCNNEGLQVLECSNCHIQKINILNKKEHNTVIDEAVEATCEKTGLTEGSHCADCGEVIVAQKAIKALGHDGSPCSRCGEVNNSTSSKPSSLQINGNNVTSNHEHKTNNSSNHTFQSITVQNNIKSETNNSNSSTIVFVALTISALGIIAYIIYKFISRN